jgi:peptidoglycan/xylan/chitin deacetylase (PgdA/CDA1 family)
MESKGIKGTAYIITGQTDQAGYMTQAHLLEMDAAGWSIANHTRDHTDLVNASQAQAEAALTNGGDDLISYGVPNAARHVAYPNGSRDAESDAAMTATGMLTGRLYSGNNFDHTAATLYQLGTFGPTNTTTLGDIQGRVNDAVANGTVCIIGFHAIVETPSVSTEWSIANFQALIDWLVAQNIPCLTIGQIYDLIT